MPWCPKCKNEYREGISVCADCGCELTNDPTALGKPLIFGEEEQMRSMRKFLEYNELKDVQLRYDEAEGVYELTVSEKDWQKANSLKKIFLEQEAVRKAEELKAQTVWEDQESGCETAQEEAGIPAERYRDNAEQAMESRISAIVLLAVGGIGLLFISLCILEVIPIKFGYSTLFFNMMAVAFFLIIVTGATSLKKAQAFSVQAKSDNTLRESILRWCKENLTAERIDSAADAGEDSGLADGVLYFRRTEQIREQINRQFMNLDQNFLERFVDEQVYDAIYGEREG